MDPVKSPAAAPSAVLPPVLPASASKKSLCADIPSPVPSFPAARVQVPPATNSLLPGLASPNITVATRAERPDAVRITVPGAAPFDLTFITKASFRLRSAEIDAKGDAVPEYMIVKPDTARATVPRTVTQEGASTVVATDAMRVRLTPSPEGIVYVTVTNARGEEVVQNWRLDPRQRTMQLALRPDERVYGFGDKRAALDQRGNTVDMLNRDAFASSTNASYKSIPFYFSDKGYGLFFHNFYPSRFEVGTTAAPDEVRAVTSGGRLDAYVFVADEPKDIVAGYTELTGRPALLPRWALGFQQSKASYKDDEAMEVAANLRRGQYPFDGIYYDDASDYATNPRWSQQLWDRHKARLTMGGNPFLIGDDYSGTMGRKHQLLSYPDGRPVIEPACEIANDKGRSDDVAYIDFFSRSATRTFLQHEWAEGLKPGTVNRDGSREPAVYLGMADFGEMDHLTEADRKQWPSIGMPVSQTRNVYALAYAQGLIDGAQNITGHRSTGMIRPGFAGTQRFGWSTTGDSMPDFENFRAHTRGLLSLTHSGFSNVGQDIGGWDHKGPDDIYARWFGAATFFPFMWAHGQGDHEPYSHGPQVGAAARSFLELRYRMLPYLYSLNEQASRGGPPMVRSMPFQDIKDRAAASIDDQFYLGDGLLVAPLFHPTSRDLYLPPGTWYDFFGERAPVAGGGRVQRDDVPLDRIPAYVKAGSIIPMGPTMQRSDETPNGPLTVHYYAHPAAEVGSRRDSTFQLYEDDGVTQGYRRGAFARTELRFTQEPGLIRFEAERVGGDRGYQPVAREHRVELHGVTPRRVLLGGVELPRGVRRGQSYWTDGPGEPTVVLAPGVSGALRIEH